MFYVEWNRNYERLTKAIQCLSSKFIRAEILYYRPYVDVV